jgi:hypothetical protein
LGFGASAGSLAIQFAYYGILLGGTGFVGDDEWTGDE